jgi:ectoine hydroxylase-related dioxygenase (phytanoyl-CoA dioxygenase family)
MNEQYQRLGIVSPILCCDEETAVNAAECIRRETKFPKPSRLTKIKKRLGLSKPTRGFDRHLDWEPIKNLVTRSPLIDAAKELLGPDLIIWRTNIFYKFGTAEDGLPWHRDIYAGILSDPESQLSVQIALTPTTVDNCLEVIPESHLLSVDEICSRWGMATAPSNEATGNIRFSGAPPEPFPVVLKPGYGCAFHHNLVHRSAVSDHPTAPRICLTVRFATASNTVQKRSQQVPCALVSGEPPAGVEFLNDWRDAQELQ